MEQVMRFFADESKDVKAQFLCGINEEELAIVKLSLMVEHGKYILGYFKADGTKKVYENARQSILNINHYPSIKGGIDKG